MTDTVDHLFIMFLCSSTDILRWQTLWTICFLLWSTTLSSGWSRLGSSTPQISTARSPTGETRCRTSRKTWKSSSAKSEPVNIKPVVLLVGTRMWRPSSWGTTLVVIATTRRRGASSVGVNGAAFSPSSSPVFYQLKAFCRNRVYLSVSRAYFKSHLS